MSKKKGKKAKRDWQKEPRPWDIKNLRGQSKVQQPFQRTRMGQKRGG